MKLADPRTIQSNINAQRKIDIDQGITLARKVDTLREQIANEENRLNLIRDGMTKEVNAQIQTLITDKTVLEEDIERLNITRALLLKPLDDEWELVKEEKEHIEIARDEIDMFRSEVEKQLKETKLKLKKISIEESRQADTRTQIQEQAKQSSEALVEARKRLTEALMEEKRVSIVSKKKMQEIEEKEAVLQATINDVSIREREIEAEWKDIHREKIVLTDQRATLERAIARLK